jgi:hypothetical protein
VQLGCGAPVRASMKLGWVDRFNTLPPQPVRVASGAAAGFSVPRARERFGQAKKISISLLSFSSLYITYLYLDPSSNHARLLAERSG